MMKTISNLKFALQYNAIAMTPCTDEEVARIEKKFSTSLPQVYKDFLLLTGKNAGKYMRGNDVFFDKIFSLQEWGAEIVEENNLTKLENRSFVFWMHQGYQFAFFNTDEGDDPPIYFFSEGRNQRDYVQAEKSLSDFLYVQIAVSGLLYPPNE